MNVLKNLLLAVAAMGVLGSVRAEIAGKVPNPDAPALADSGARFASGTSISYSFADLVNLPAVVEQPLLPGDAFSRVPDGTTLAELSNVADSTPLLPAGANAAGSMLGAVSTLNGAIEDLSAVVVADASPVSRPGTSRRQAGPGFLFSTAEIPEPSDWMTLLCGLVVVAFMARRKTGAVAN